MKNFKTKIGISLTTLACFFALNVVPANATLMEWLEEERLANSDVMKSREDSNVMNLVNTLRITAIENISGYELPDGRRVVFSNAEDKDKNPYLELRIIGEPDEYGDLRILIIQDYGFNNLDAHDKIGFGIKYNDGSDPYIRTLKFHGLSNEVKLKVTEEYNLRIKEAPLILASKYRKNMQEEKLKENQKKKQLENEILEFLK